MTQTFVAGAVLTATQTNTDLANPTGVMAPYAGATAPTGWLLCDGTAVSRTTYAELFAITSTTYGVGNGTTTFNVPDLRGRIPVGAGTGAQNGGSGTGAISGGTALTARTRGAFAGDERMQDHTHIVTNGTFVNHDVPAGGLSVLRGGIPPGVTTSGATNAGGSGGNTQPFVVFNYIVKT